MSNPVHSISVSPHDSGLDRLTPTNRSIRKASNRCNPNHPNALPTGPRFQPGGPREHGPTQAPDRPIPLGASRRRPVASPWPSKSYDWTSDEATRRDPSLTPHVGKPTLDFSCARGAFSIAPCLFLDRHPTPSGLKLAFLAPARQRWRRAASKSARRASVAAERPRSCCVSGLMNLGRWGPLGLSKRPAQPRTRPNAARHIFAAPFLNAF